MDDRNYSGQNWLDNAEQYIACSDIIIYFISDNSFVSGSVLEEVKFGTQVRKYILILLDGTTTLEKKEYFFKSKNLEVIKVAKEMYQAFPENMIYRLHNLDLNSPQYTPKLIQEDIIKLRPDLINNFNNTESVNDVVTDLHKLTVDDGIKLYNKSSYQEAKNIFEENMDDENALFHLGNMFHLGQGVEINNEKAIELFEKASKLGHSDSIFILGQFYEDGIGVQKNMAKAVELYDKAAKLNNPYAQFCLGQCNYKGNEVCKDLKKAFNLIEMSSKENLNFSIYWLARFYEKGIGVEKNIEKAIELYKEAFSKGYSDAAVSLGDIYKNGIYLKKAFKYYQDAANCGSQMGKLNLFDCYYNGRGTEKNRAKANELVKELKK